MGHRHHQHEHLYYMSEMTDCMCILIDALLYCIELTLL